MSAGDRQTPDLVGELDRIVEEAREARRKLAAGHALTGRSALRRIEERAMDAARHAREHAEGRTG